MWRVAGPDLPASDRGPAVTVQSVASATYDSGLALAQAFGATVIVVASRYRGDLLQLERRSRPYALLHRLNPRRRGAHFVVGYLQVVIYDQQLAIQLIGHNTEHEIMGAGGSLRQIDPD